jgi:transposase-like protein
MMRTSEINFLKKMLQKLSLSQRREIKTELDQFERRAKSVEITEGDMGETGTCPHCGDADHIRHGSPDGLQRYRCNGCGRTVQRTDWNALAGLHQKGKWLSQMQAPIDGLPLSQISDRLNIAHSTAFR